MTMQRKFWMRWRVRLGYPVAAIFWLLATPSPRWILLGAAFAMLGLLVRTTAAGYLRKSRELAISGPYARTRNPLYFGSALIAAGFVIAGHSWRAGTLVAVYFAVFYYAVMRNEEEELRSLYGAAFEDYAARVPLFSRVLSMRALSLARNPLPSRNSHGRSIATTANIKLSLERLPRC